MAVLSASNIYPPLPTMAELAAKEIAKQDEITSIKILAGFDYVVDGKEYHFSYGLEDQTNFAMGINSANLSIQLGSMAADQINKLYPGYLTKDGATHPEVLTVKLPDDWVLPWQGHADGTAYTLALPISKFLDVANAGGLHNQTLLAIGQEIKRQLRACKTEAELKLLVKELDLDRALTDARDYKTKHNL